MRKWLLLSPSHDVLTKKIHVRDMVDDVWDIVVDIPDMDDDIPGCRGRHARIWMTTSEMSSTISQTWLFLHRRLGSEPGVAIVTSAVRAT